MVPLGATEQHGPHLPLSTDTDVAVALAERLAARRDDVDVTPAVAFGASGEHAGFAGTLSLGTPALEHLLVELCRSATQTWEQILLLSGHGGNADAVRRAIALLRRESRDVRAWAPSWPGDAHAGRVETSLQLALAPDRVHLELAEAGPTEPVQDLMSRLREGGVVAVSSNGVLGDPTGACAQEGHRLLDEAVGLLDAWLA